jgi:catechol 2,3-dioxygenase-like lactoylglutathione lyase family enzyme
MSDEFERARNIVKRTTLIVRDIQTSRHWYQHVLGLSVYSDSEFIHWNDWPTAVDRPYNARSSY